MFLLGRFDTAAFTTPGHDCRVRSQTAFQRFVPTDHLTAVGVQELFGFMNHVALQTFLLGMLLVRFQAQGLDACLTLRTGFPLHLRTLVTPYVDVFRRENLDDFGQYVLDELDGLVVSGTQYVVRNAPLGPYLIRTAGTTQFRISGQCSLHVSRQVDFRNDGNVAVCRILYDFLGLFLGIETTVRLAVVFAGVTADDRFLAL